MNDLLDYMPYSMREDICDARISEIKNQTLGSILKDEKWTPYLDSLDSYYSIKHKPEPEPEPEPEPKSKKDCGAIAAVICLQWWQIFD